MCFLNGALTSTSSGSLLVSKTQMTSVYKIAAPVIKKVPELLQLDWSLLAWQPSHSYKSQESHKGQIKELTENLAWSQAVIHVHELMEESCVAQLVIQHTVLTKLNQSSH